MAITKRIKSNEKREIVLIERKPREFDKTVLMIGCFHGDEPEGELLINNFLSNFPKKIKNRVLMIPCLNPDGKSKKTRQNAHKVDINRNFPTKNWKKIEDKDYFGGEKSNSEVETQFLVDILEEYKIDAILSLHTPYEVVNYDGPAKELAEVVSKITHYPIKEDIGYPTPGSFGTYAGKERNIPTVTLELSENKDIEDLWKQNNQIFDFLANRF